jgi:autonomous glycyl radical cofactor GrcA
MHRLLQALVCATILAQADDGIVFYSKSFPGSKPEYMEIEIQATGEAQYKESAADDLPVKFKLLDEERTAIYALVEKLEFFQRKLESGLPVAKMGEKTYRYSKDGKKYEVKFNYSQDLDAQALQDWFEKMTETVNLFYDLDRTVRFEPLGVNRALLLLESAWDRKRLIGIELYYPLLNRVIKNDRYLNMDRERAGRLKTAFEESRKK